ncbi:MAG TPA: SDR family NAD(P)-dependent oxidoreductase [Caulobacteraceae bacterium]|nr:SDR family NAD(P)-dependent oxidoreductase [Caulobacteraceae bacterium]
MSIQDLAGKGAVITGAASGIGLALARACAAKGMRLVLSDVEPGPLERAAGELGAKAIPADVRDAQSLQALARAAEAHLGQVDLLCANAGVSRMAAIERLTAEDWRWLFDVNLFGVVETVRAFLPGLKANPAGGHIVITASLSSLYPTRSQGAYAATKAAVAMYGETLALELQGEGSKVGVSLVCPGPVRTQIGTSVRNRGSGYSLAAPPAGVDIHEQAFRASVREGDWALPEDIARIALEAVRTGELWAITHPEMMDLVTERHHAIEQAGERQASAER